MICECVCVQIISRNFDLLEGGVILVSSGELN